MVNVLVTTLAGQGAVLVTSPKARLSRLLVHCHGGDDLFEVPTNVVNHPEWVNLMEMATYLADRHYAVLFPALYDASLTYTSATWPTQGRGQTYGNNASTTQLAAVIAAAQALSGISAGKYALSAHSMGNFTLTNHLRRIGAGQSSVAGALAVCPAADLSFHRGTDAAPKDGGTADGQYAIVNRAHAIGGANGTTACDSSYFSPGTVDSTFNPITFAAASLTTRWHAWTNTNDTTAPPANAVTLAGLIPGGKGTTESRGSGGHDFSGCVGKDAHAYLDSLSW